MNRTIRITSTVCTDTYVKLKSFFTCLINPAGKLSSETGNLRAVIDNYMWGKSTKNNTKNPTKHNNYNVLIH